MPSYLHQLAYTPEGWAALVKNPQDRFEAVRPVFESLGGKLVSGYFCFGEYDLVAISEFPTNVDVAAVAIAIAAGGTVKSMKTTPLMTTEEAVAAMRKAGTAGYRPASGG